ncbi:class I SAM-dependent methyltransferase [Algimonas porphyrae]|uniref:Methyltransferase n=1 Tax=Algimonas porphyrae TaxID=1128113 RepID=A0ABQ5V1P9_9PROT|nr:hypothetical protein [Algimonas porphyrae]GLQ20882.1 methyltransferase [Algimonas porphyrae]
MIRSHYFKVSLSALACMTLIAACSPADGDVADTTDAGVAEVAVETQTADVATMTFDADAMTAVLNAQDDTAKARFNARNPGETLQFFGIAPGMAVGDALPGGGWYSKILLPYLGDEGRMVAVDYTIPMWGEFGFATEEFLASKETWADEWVTTARGWTDADIDIEAYTFETLPQDGSLDAFLFIRALHNLSRFNAEGNYMTDALTAVYGSLIPGGVVGVVQHAGPDDADAAWANGSNGYLRKPDVIAAFEAAGFVLDGESDINANPNDMPTTDDMVWRLPPTLGTSNDNPELRAEMEAIGETNRMTLKFRKPG